jgi:hypothetical protein
MHIHHDSIVTLELPYRERLALRRTVFHGGDGPKVAVLAGVHGDELEGLYVCHRLAAWLEALASSPRLLACSSHTWRWGAGYRLET